MTDLKVVADNSDNIVILSDEELLEEGLNRLDEALSYIMEMQAHEGKALANIIYGAAIFGEMYANNLKEQDNVG